MLASRLHAHFPLLSILLIEAGPDVTNHPLVTDGRNAGRLVGSELDWNYSTVPQMYLNNRACPSLLVKPSEAGNLSMPARKKYPPNPRRQMLTYPSEGGWIGGYYAWAKLVNDSRWSCKGMLPYFRMAENYHSADLYVNKH